MKTKIIVFETQYSKYQLSLGERIGEFYRVILMQLSGGTRFKMGVAASLPEEGKPFSMSYCSDNGTRTLTTSEVTKTTEA